jgi:hypothetical protein
MSEVKRDVCHACVSLPREIHCPVCDPDRGWREEIDAQRLRSDTAEAERDALRYKAELYDEVCGDATGRGYANVTMALCALSAAEQRTAELLVMLRQAWVDECVSAEDCRKIDAALNQKSEAESQ